MTATVPGFIPNEMKTSVVKIYSYHNRQLRGTLWNPYYQQERYFDNALQLLFLLDELTDALHFPQKTMEDRSFSHHSPTSAIVSESESACCEGNTETTILATLRIKILFRQNASWQGTIGWTEQQSEASFRSVLELLKLIDSILMQ